MFSRLNGEKKGGPFPEEWIEEVKNLFESVYKEQTEKINRSIMTYGEIFENEIIFAVSLLSQENLSAIPITFFLSAELNEKKDVKKTLDLLVNASGLLLDDYFSKSSEDWEGQFDLWTKAEIKKQEFHYKTNRENIYLTIEANKLLENS